MIYGDRSVMWSVVSSVYATIQFSILDRGGGQMFIIFIDLLGRQLLIGDNSCSWISVGASISFI